LLRLAERVALPRAEYEPAGGGPCRRSCFSCRRAAVASPHLGDCGNVDVALLVLRVGHRRGPGVRSSGDGAGIGVAQDVQPFRVE